MVKRRRRSLDERLRSLKAQVDALEAKKELQRSVEALRKARDKAVAAFKR